VTVQNTTTAGYINFNCIQTTANQVNCTIVITSSGNLVIHAQDLGGLSSTATESNYIVNPVVDPPEPNPPIITITAPTKTNIGNITNTTIKVTSTEGVNASDVVISNGTTVNYINFNCIQTTSNQVNCTIVITKSGNLVIYAEDVDGRSSTASSNNYVVNTVTTTPPPSQTPSPNPVPVPVPIPQTTTLPVISFVNGTKFSTASIKDTIKIIAPNGIKFSNVAISTESTAIYEDFNCKQVSEKEVECEITITSNGNIVVNAIDNLGKVSVLKQNDYVIESQSTWEDSPSQGGSTPIPTEQSEGSSEKSKSNLNSIILYFLLIIVVVVTVTLRFVYLRRSSNADSSQSFI
jgi:hypothetical protein